MKITNKVKTKIRAGEASLGGWCLTGSPISAEIMAQAGFDWVCVDEEHSSANPETIQAAFIAIERNDAEPFIRVSLCEEVAIKKALDAGAKGVLVPMITSYQSALDAVRFTKYAPVGNRSFALPRATGYGKYSKDYFEQANDAIFLGIMIEHVDALPELDQIFSIPEIDSILVGPYDLSGSMGIPGQFDHPDFQKALKTIYQKAAEHKVNMGIHEVHPTREKIENYISEGYTFIGCGIDTLFIRESAEALVKQSC